MCRKARDVDVALTGEEHDQVLQVEDAIVERRYGLDARLAAAREVHVLQVAHAELGLSHVLVRHAEQRRQLMLVLRLAKKLVDVLVFQKKYILENFSIWKIWLFLREKMLLL